MLYTTTDSPLGQLLLAGDGSALTHLVMQEGRRPLAIDSSWERSAKTFREPLRQLEEYFDGRRREFTVPLALTGNPFELRVWDALVRIPYGETTSYGEAAATIGQPDAARAVGLANGRNPVAVIVPCHRVLGAKGSLIGYGGGLERKRLLLDLEAGVLQLSATASPSGRAA
jgi:methylated-DNA-[protein]-cysteine S-methyltransferase